MAYIFPFGEFTGNIKLTRLTDRISGRHFRGNGDLHPMLNNAPVLSFADAGFGMGAGVRDTVLMMVISTITTRMRGGGG